MMRILGVASVRSYDGAHKLVTRAAGRTTTGPRVYALHLAGRMSALGLGTPRSCSSAVKLLKQVAGPFFISFVCSILIYSFVYSSFCCLHLVAERGAWAEELDAARDAVDQGELNEALRRYLPLAQVRCSFRWLASLVLL